MSGYNVPPLNESSRQNAALLEQMRQHMSNLVAATHLLTPAIREAGDAKYDQYLAIASQSVYRILRLINHLDLSQTLMRGGVPYRPAPLDLAGLCRETADETAPLAELAGINFRYESEVTSLLTTGDGGLLRRLLLGLFSNALRAAGEGGETGLHLQKQKTRAVLTVWDNGPGLAEEELSQDDGLGLGLSIIRELAALHDGAVMLESRPERGVRAVVSLPIRPPEGGPPRTPPASKWDLDGGFSPVLVELSSVLPYGAFLPDDLE